jgi:hypothetical protein
MSKIYRFTVALALCACTLVGLCFLTGYKGGGLVALVFLPPVLWTLWLACVVIDFEREKWRLILLWILIDITILGVVVLSSMGHKPSAKSGEEFFFLIEFFPIFLPMLLASACFPIIGVGVSAIGRGASYVLLPMGVATDISDWLSFSVLSAVSSCLLVGLYCCVKVMRERKRQHAKLGAS